MTVFFGVDRTRQRHVLAHFGAVIKPPGVLDPRPPGHDVIETAQPAVVGIDVQRGYWKRGFGSRRQRGLWSGWRLREDGGGPVPSERGGEDREDVAAIESQWGFMVRPRLLVILGSVRAAVV